MKARAELDLIETWQPVILTTHGHGVRGPQASFGVHGKWKLDRNNGFDAEA